MLTPLPGGVANRAFLLRADLVLRVPRSREFAADLRKEAAILPVVSSSGVRTAELLAHGEGFAVTRRLPGSAPSDVEPRTAFEVGRELATLHGIGSRVPGVPGEAVADPHALVARLAGEGWIDRASAAWLDGWFRKLAQPPVANVLTHGDVAPQNLLVDAGGALTGLIDWGDAAYADPATDFAKLRFASVPARSPATVPPAPPTWSGSPESCGTACCGHSAACARPRQCGPAIGPHRRCPASSTCCTSSPRIHPSLGRPGRRLSVPRELDQHLPVSVSRPAR